MNILFILLFHLINIFIYFRYEYFRLIIHWCGNWQDFPSFSGSFSLSVCVCTLQYKSGFVHIFISTELSIVYVIVDTILYKYSFVSYSFLNHWTRLLMLWCRLLIRLHCFVFAMIWNGADDSSRIQLTDYIIYFFCLFFSSFSSSRSHPTGNR